MQEENPTNNIPKDVLGLTNNINISKYTAKLGWKY
jgi:hypothetical protein